MYSSACPAHSSSCEGIDLDLEVREFDD